MVKWTMAGAQIVRAPSSNSRAGGNDVRKASAVAAAATGQLIVANSSRCAATNGPALRTDRSALGDKCQYLGTSRQLGPRQGGRPRRSEPGRSYRPDPRGFGAGKLLITAIADVKRLFRFDADSTQRTEIDLGVWLGHALIAREGGALKDRRQRAAGPGNNVLLESVADDAESDVPACQLGDERHHLGIGAGACPYFFLRSLMADPFDRGGVDGARQRLRYVGQGIREGQLPHHDPRTPRFPCSSIRIALETQRRRKRRGSRRRNWSFGDQCFVEIKQNCVDHGPPR